MTFKLLPSTVAQASAAPSGSRRPPVGTLPQKVGRSVPLSRGALSYAARQGRLALPFFSRVILIVLGLYGLTCAQLHAQFPPIITTQPVSQSVLAGSNATFWVIASSTTTLSYQWRFNGVNIPYATNYFYVRYNVTLADRGGYTVQVNNAGGSVLSDIAYLTVLVPPQITYQPKCQVTPPGGSATFGVGIADGATPAPTFQWRLNGVNIPGATNTTLSLPQVRSNQAGLYTVRIANAGGAVISQTASLSIALSSLRAQWEGMPQPGVNPFLISVPDAYGAAGPAGIVATINSRISYYSKTGSNHWLQPVGLTNFWRTVGSTGNNMGSAKVVYDPGAGCFYAIMSENPSPLNRSFLYLAVSKDSHPLSYSTNHWLFYRVELTESYASTNYGCDYPGLGFDQQAVYLTYNMFSLPLRIDSAFANCQIVAFDKTALTNGQLVYRTYFTPDGTSGGFGLLPLTSERTSTNQMASSSAPVPHVAWFVETPLFDPTNVRIWALTEPLASGTLCWTNVPVPDNGGPASGAPQAGTNLLVETVSPVTQSAVVDADGAAWMCHTAGGRFGKAMVFYYKVQLNDFPANTPILSESGRLEGGPGVSTFLPALAANAGGELCLAFCQSSGSNYPSIAYTTRSRATGHFDSPAVVKHSPAFINGQHWGHFAGVSVDPADGSFWFAQPWVKSRNYYDWSTWWANVDVFTIPAFHNPRLRPDAFAANLTLEAGTVYVLEISTDLQSWIPLGTNTSPAGAELLLDTLPLSGNRFFRVRTP